MFASHIKILITITCLIIIPARAMQKASKKEQLDAAIENLIDAFKKKNSETLKKAIQSIQEAKKRYWFFQRITKKEIRDGNQIILKKSFEAILEGIDKKSKQQANLDGIKAWENAFSSSKIELKS